MVISIDNNKILEKGLTSDQFFLMLMLYLKIDTNTINTDDLLNKGFIGNKYEIDPSTNKLVKSNEYFLAGKGNDLVNDILLNSVGVGEKVKQSTLLEELAKQMQEIYPKGKKPGTNYYWRDSTPVIMKKLQIFFKRYGDIPHDIILEATKKYVSSYGDSTKLMQLLKYFIWKNRPDGSEESTLLSYIENFEDNESPCNNEDWTSKLN